MRSRMRTIRDGEQVSLITENGGRALFWIVWIEVSALGLLLWELSSVVGNPDILVTPLLASGALVLWTVFQIEPDYRVSIDLTNGEGSISRIPPISGATTTATFEIADLESIALQKAETANRGRFAEYVVAVDLRGGRRHVVTPGGPFLSYRREVDRFCHATGICTRVVK